MHAIRVHRYGDPDVLVWGEAARAEPAPGQVLVKVIAVGVNFADIYQRRGRNNPPLPFTPGLEASGVVEKVGAGVTAFRPGDRVASARAIGSYAQYCAVDATKLLALPSDISFEIGAAFALQGMTAHYLLHEFRPVQNGDSVLIHAAAGGVGRLAVQMAKHMGARVIGTVSTREKAAIAREAGADDVIVYTEKDFVEETKRLTGGEGVDLIFDGVSRSTFPGDLQAIKIRGHIVVFGSASGRADPVEPNILQGRSISLSGGTLGDFIRTPEEMQSRADFLFAGIREGWLTIKIDRALPLAEAAKAHALLESRQTSGKLLLTA